MPLQSPTLDIRSFQSGAPQRALLELASGLCRLSLAEREVAIDELVGVGPVEQLARFRKLHPALVSRPV